MTGRELCEAIQSRFPDRKFPVYVVSAATARVHREWVREMRDTYFLEKPISIRQLVRALKNQPDPS